MVLDEIGTGDDDITLLVVDDGNTVTVEGYLLMIGAGCVIVQP